MPETTHQFLFPKNLNDLQLKIIDLFEKLKIIIKKLKNKLDEKLIYLYKNIIKIKHLFDQEQLNKLKNLLEKLYAGLIYLTIPVIAVYKGGKKETLGYDEHCLL
ncbi:hypothetical protein M153_3830003922 [Pseudoloma neurophilia]|uniref:Uncharacterized protein n=1 Tax=Pseudoloma neurophilia TaxID=146866 RepID=A0A0R0LXT0_9MICR|nr:hypothetical protein M153_3830003922 [Pseudoloma neurophilia]